MTTTPTKSAFTNYQIFIIAILAVLQFTIVLDFMVLSPLGAILLKELSITTAQFGLVVSSYAFSAGASGLLAAGFADKYDRKKILIFFYIGFIMGTFLCGIASTYNFLLIARIVTGIFGGVIGSISFAIITDLFAIEVRGRVMGFVQMAFASSQVLGIPLGLYLATEFDWHAPFLLIVGISVIIALLIVIYVKPITGHLKLQKDNNAFQHLGTIINRSDYLKAFAATTLLATGGFMLMPFGSAFSVNNLGIALEKLPLLYMATGICTMIASPYMGKLSDKIGKYTIFCIGSVIAAITVIIYCNLSISPLWFVILINVIMMVGITSRMISATALMTAVPDAKDRGAFMGINSSVQQVSGGLAAMLAGWIVTETPSGVLENYDLLGYVVVVATVITIALMYYIHTYVKRKTTGI
jgi:predicted MFS family arabinose efflux permease